MYRCIPMKNPLAFDCIIIGAGPAGLFVAANVSCKRVLLLEKKESAGKKLLISGSGRCNLTHSGSIGEFIDRYGDAGRFVRNALYGFSNLSLMEWFISRGLDLVTDKNGKVFPASDSARDVLLTLQKACIRNQVEIRYNQPVASIEKTVEGFRVFSGDREYFSRMLVITTGGLSYPSTGSSGDGIRLAMHLGHSVIPPKPALTPVINRELHMDELAGISLKDLQMSLYREGKKIREIRGDIGFTHKGISGPGILDSSRYMQVGDIIRFNFCGLNPDVFRKQLIDASSIAGKTTLMSYLRSFELPRSLVQYLLDRMSIPAEQVLACMEKGQRNMIVENFTAFPVTIQALGGYKEAMVTSGGVSRTGVNPATMESKLIPGLFFAGEVLDVDGDSGGYNLQFAFSSAFLAATAISGHEKSRNR